MLVLEVDTGNAPEGRVHFKVEFQGVMEMRGVEEGMERVTMVFFEGSFTEVVGSNGDVDRQDRRRSYQGIRCRFHLSRRRSRHAMDIWRSPTITLR